MEVIRSPFFYVGDKYKLMKQLSKLFPKNIDNYFEPFCGGGSSFLNTQAEKYIVNDIDANVINLHNFFQKNVEDKDLFYNDIFKLINKYNLSCSYLGITVPETLKKQHVKTYYAKHNKNAYIQMRNDFNEDQSNMYLLYLLLIYGFNHMIRFNATGKFNLPVGNVDYNKNVSNAIQGYMGFLEKNHVVFKNMDFETFIIEQKFSFNDFVFCDPPYLISQSEYNKIWSEEHEERLYKTLDYLNSIGVKFGLTNLIRHKGKENTILIKWMKKYTCYNVNSNYISFNDNTIKENSKEVYITNG